MLNIAYRDCKSKTACGMIPQAVSFRGVQVDVLMAFNRAP